jgi:hypothetical protein
MMSKLADETPAFPAADASLTFVDLLRTVIEHRKLIVVGTLLALSLGGAYVAFVGALYRGQAVLNLRNISFAEYKRYSPTLGDRERFLEFAARSKRFSDADLEKIRRAIAGPDAVSRWVHPLFTMTKSDVKDAAEIPKDANQFTGVDIDVSMNSRDLAESLVVISADYVRGFVMEGKVNDLVLPGLAKAVTESTRKRLDILRTRFDLERLKQRRAELQAIAKQYRGAEREVSQRQVISTQDGGERYLSPITQVIGVEAQIVEINSELSGLEREVQRLEVLVDFYKNVRKRLESARLGEQFAAVDLAYAELQKNKDLASEPESDAAGSIRVELEELRAYDSDFLRMVGKPSTQSQIRSLIVWAPLLLAALAGFLLSLFLAIMLAWWRRNRSAVVDQT